MKKYLIAVATLAVLATMPACNTKEQKTDSATTGQAQAEQTQTEVTTLEGYTPSGDPTKDAQEIANLTIDLSRKMMAGESNADEQARVDKMIRVANDFYTQKEQGEEFQHALTEATEAAVNELATELGK